MTYQVRVEPRARRFYLSLDKPLRDRIGAAIDSLADDPRPYESESLTGILRVFRKIRVGNYRVCYTVDDKSRLVTVVEVEHRSRVYGDLARRR